MDMGSLPSFTANWIAMTAVMMLPSTGPFVVCFARGAQPHVEWPAATGVLVAAYLCVWAVFGVCVYEVSSYVMLPRPKYAAALAIAFAGLYALTPLRRLGQARCIEMCRAGEPLRGRALPESAVKGAWYGLSCVACSAGIMVAVFALGMSNVWWMLAGAAVIALYKSAAGWAGKVDVALSISLVVAGIALAGLALPGSLT